MLSGVVFVGMLMLQHKCVHMSRCCLHIGVFSVPARLVQPDARFLILPAVPQQHLLCEGSILLCTVP